MCTFFSTMVSGSLIPLDYNHSILQCTCTYSQVWTFIYIKDKDHKYLLGLSCFQRLSGHMMWVWKGRLEPAGQFMEGCQGEKGLQVESFSSWC